MVEREWFDKDYYKVLGLSSSATRKRSRAPICKLAKSSHPDTNPGVEEKFKEVSVAYDVLGDKEKRKEYVTRFDVSDRPRPASALPVLKGGGGFNFHDGRLRAISGDIFGGLFGGGRRQRANAAPISTPPALHLGFRDAVVGVTTSVNLPSNGGVPTLQGEWCRARDGALSRCERCGRSVVCSTTTRDRSPCRASVRSVRVRGGRIVTALSDLSRQPGASRPHAR